MVNQVLDCGLLVFTKAPIAGQVKTRMQPRLNEAQSALLHQNLVRHCLTFASNIKWPRLELWIGGPHSWWEELENTYPITLHEQVGRDLGERMYNAIRMSFDEHLPVDVDHGSAAQSLIVIGTDCPHINVDYLLSAADALRNYDVVLGPANDGGYVLIGFGGGNSGRHKALFSNINWGSDQVLAQTRRRLMEQNLSWYELEALSDIDRPEDLQLLEKHFPNLLQDVVDDFSPANK